MTPQWVRGGKRWKHWGARNALKFSVALADMYLLFVRRREEDGYQRPLTLLLGDVRLCAGV